MNSDLNFTIVGKYIQLDQLLKATGLCSSGGEAHQWISEGKVWVDGQIEFRKRAKIYPGQTVKTSNRRILLEAEMNNLG